MSQNSKLRIAIIADPFLPVPPVGYGGIERIINLLINYLVAQEHELVLVANKDSKVSIPLIPFPEQSGKLKHLNNILAVNKIRAFKPDIIHSFGRLAYLLPFLRSDIPKIMSYQREPTLAQISKSIRLAKSNTLSFTGCSNYISNKIKIVASATTIYNGFPPDTYTPNFEIEQDAPLVFLGRLEEIKGVHLAIEVARKTNRKLVIAGNIPPEGKDYFETAIQPHLNEQITYIGIVNDEQKNEMLRHGAALLMPILWEEPFGIVMVEAMACGTPVIALNRGSVPEVVTENVTGFVCKNVDELITAVNQIKKLNRAKVYKKASQRFNSDVIGETYLNLYRNKINEFN
ncbi:glycosyltransferase involved in cell wall biosynthesis [Pedobacter sp. UYEF25]